MDEESNACPECGRGTMERIAAVSHRSSSTEVFRCSECRVERQVRVDPEPDEAAAEGEPDPE